MEYYWFKSDILEKSIDHSHFISQDPTQNILSKQNLHKLNPSISNLVPGHATIPLLEICTVNSPHVTIKP